MKEKFPFILAVFSIVLGVFISILFGINEGIFKNSIAEKLNNNTKISSIENSEKRQKVMAKEKSKNWRYFQRFHFHSTGIGTISLSVLLVLVLSAAPMMLKTISAYMISIGGFFYPFVWLFAGIYGPVMGRNEAKEAFAVFGYMGGVSFLGLILALFLLIKYPINFPKNTTES